MADMNEKQGSEEEVSIDKLLRDREKIDAQLKHRFSHNVTVMFTDIKGSTNYFEIYGDIEGRLMVQKHNEILFPIVEKFNGRVIKTIGDAIMAAFDQPDDGVRAAVAMQENISRYNKDRKEKRDQIHIRIGVNTGEGLVEKEDIFGDVVNVAARVESLAEPDEILVSRPVYDEVRKTDDIICRYVKQAKVKGKENPIEIFRVIWAEEQYTEVPTRSVFGRQQKRAQESRRLEINIHRQEDILLVTAAVRSGKSESTIQSYDELRVSMQTVEEQCREITALLSQANSSGRVSKKNLLKLRNVGRKLFDTLLSKEAKQCLQDSTVNDLVFYIEDSLVQVPWELLYDGESFLCQKFNMGRVVKTKHSDINIKYRQMSRPLKMLLVCDPEKNLENSSMEADSIMGLLDPDSSFIYPSRKSSQITAEYLMEKIKNFDLVHYAGHADYDPENPSNSGWLLNGGKLSSSDIMKLAGGRPMPCLVFSNACYSGQTDGWEIGSGYNQKIFGLANAFLLAGVQHYIGTFREIPDEAGQHFAVAFYRAMLEGAAIGDAVRQARISLIKQFGEDRIVWASYMLYGDPGVNYLGLEKLSGELGSGEDSHHPPDQKDSEKKDELSFNRMVVPAVLLVLMFLIGMFFLYTGNKAPGDKDRESNGVPGINSQNSGMSYAGLMLLPDEDPDKFERLAALFFRKGDYDKALEMSSKCLEMKPDCLYALVIKGNILLLQGDLNAAMKSYQKASDLDSGLKWQKAEALNGLGRICSSRGETEKAMEFYARAASLNPENPLIHVNYGMVMQKAGDSQGALKCFQDAARLNPDDRFLSVMLARALEQQESVRQDKIDQLVEELAEAFRSPGMVSPDTDQWTSRPLIMSFIGFKAKGAPGLREGEDEFFLLQTGSMIAAESSINIVERQVMDKLLSELKLGSSQLADPVTALRLGRILSANIIATGSLIHYKNQYHISLKLIDTETTAIKSAIVLSGTDLDRLARETAAQAVQKLQTAYLLRGEILSVSEGRVMLNIGFRCGVKKGMKFRMLQGPRTDTLLKKGLNPSGFLTSDVPESDRTPAVVSENTRMVKQGMRVEQILETQEPETP